MPKIYRVSDSEYEDGSVEYFHTLESARTKANELIAKGDVTAVAITRLLVAGPSTAVILKILNNEGGWVQDTRVIEELRNA